MLARKLAGRPRPHNVLIALSVGLALVAMFLPWAVVSSDCANIAVVRGFADASALQWAVVYMLAFVGVLGSTRVSGARGGWLIVLGAVFALAALGGLTDDLQRSFEAFRPRPGQPPVGVLCQMDNGAGERVALVATLLAGVAAALRVFRPQPPGALARNALMAVAIGAALMWPVFVTGALFEESFGWSAVAAATLALFALSLWGWLSLRSRSATAAAPRSPAAPLAASEKIGPTVLAALVAAATSAFWVPFLVDAALDVAATAGSLLMLAGLAVVGALAALVAWRGADHPQMGVRTLATVGGFLAVGPLLLLGLRLLHVARAGAAILADWHEQNGLLGPLAIATLASGGALALVVGAAVLIGRRGAEPAAR